MLDHTARIHVLMDTDYQEEQTKERVRDQERWHPGAELNPLVMVRQAYLTRVWRHAVVR